MTRVRAIDPTTLPKHFDSVAAETRWDDHWDQLGVYRYDATRPRDETFVVDTPPPTVSGSPTWYGATATMERRWTSPALRTRSSRSCKVWSTLAPSR